MTSTQIVPALLVPFFAWRIYRRFRRSVGRQVVQPGRLKASIGIFSVITLAFALGALLYLPALEALAGGLALSIPLAVYGLRLTRFEITPGGGFYTPNTALGIAVSALFLGRIAYRFLVLYAAPGLQAPQAPLPFQSPLTYFLFGLSAGYFIAYYTGVLRRTGKPA